MCSKPRSTRAYPVGKLMKDKLCSQKATISNQRVFFVFCTYLGFGHLVLYRKDHTDSLIKVCEHLILERWGSKRSNLKSKDGGAKEDWKLARRCEPGNAACAVEGVVSWSLVSTCHQGWTPRPLKMTKIAGKLRGKIKAWISTFSKRKPMMEQYYDTEQCPIQPVNRICKRK